MHRTSSKEIKYQNIVILNAVLKHPVFNLTFKPWSKPSLWMQFCCEVWNALLQCLMPAIIFLALVGMLRTVQKILLVYGGYKEISDFSQALIFNSFATLIDLTDN